MTEKNNKVINCPQCGHSISIDEILTKQIETKIKNDFEEKHRIQEAEFIKKDEQLKQQAEIIAKDKKNLESVINSKVAEQLAASKLDLFREAKAEVEKEQTSKIALLEESIKNKDEKLRQATEKEIVLRKEKMQLEEAKQSFELEKIRQLEEAKNAMFEDAKKKAAEEQQYIIAQLKKQLTDATKAKDELARKLEQGSQQTQGEVLELELEDLLKSEFPHDEILPVPKGVKGADIIHKRVSEKGYSYQKSYYQLQLNYDL